MFPLLKGRVGKNVEQYVLSFVPRIYRPIVRMVSRAASEMVKVEEEAVVCHDYIDNGCDLDMIKSMHALGVPMETAATSACNVGRVDILEWAIYNDYSSDPMHLYMSAAMNGHYNVLSWLYSHNISYHGIDMSMYILTAKSPADLLEFLFTNKHIDTITIVRLKWYTYSWLSTTEARKLWTWFYMHNMGPRVLSWPEFLCAFNPEPYILDRMAKFGLMPRVTCDKLLTTLNRTDILAKLCAEHCLCGLPERHR